MERSLPPEDTMYNALLNKDSSFDGIFIVAVKTTGIFCRPTCTARKPKQKNVEYFPSCRDALHHGYRPCKICRPLSHTGDTPGWLKPLIDELDADPSLRLKDFDLRERGLEPNRVRRWFKKHHDMTFQEYSRSIKIGGAFGRIKHGEKVIDAAFESGYESLSGFTESFKKATGFSPNKSRFSRVILITRIPTPLGPMLAGADEDGISLFEFIDRKMLPTQLARLSKYLRADLIPGSSPHFDTLDRQMKEYFSGTRTEFTLPLVLAGTPFQKQVWAELQRIPYGGTRSYKEQAAALGNPKAVRAVARANGDNKIAIIIPCHRVIGASGELVGYGGGLERKRFLLDLEARNS
jgi:AraC family transcriptional regulator of adaptative response/methylated-DNA-[protein]-cysteine methyltransferase